MALYFAISTLVFVQLRALPTGARAILPASSSSLGPSVPDTAEQGLGPRGGFQLSFMGWSRGPPEGGEQFLKFCLGSDMGLSRALSSVLILIWGLTEVG